MKQTPAPWVAVCVGSGGRYDNPTDIYEVNNTYIRICEHVTEDDARLIAAAPALLAALSELVAERDNDFHNNTEGFNMARAALSLVGKS